MRINTDEAVQETFCNEFMVPDPNGISDSL